MIDNNSWISGTFNSPTQIRLRPGFTIGGRKYWLPPGKAEYFDGEIASFEAYQQDGMNIERDGKPGSSLCNITPVPDFLRDLVYKYQKVEEDFYSFDWLTHNLKRRGTYKSTNW